MPVTDDPYYTYSVLTHSGATSADTGSPTDPRIFLPRTESAVLLCCASLTAGSATVRLKIYDGRLDLWCNGESITLSPGATAWKWDTAGRRVAVYLESITTGPVSISAVIADNYLAGL